MAAFPLRDKVSIGTYPMTALRVACRMHREMSLDCPVCALPRTAATGDRTTATDPLLSFEPPISLHNSCHLSLTRDPHQLRRRRSNICNSQLPTVSTFGHVGSEMNIVTCVLNSLRVG